MSDLHRPHPSFRSRSCPGELGTPRTRRARCLPHLPAGRPRSARRVPRRAHSRRALLRYRPAERCRDAPAAHAARPRGIRGRHGRAWRRATRIASWSTTAPGTNFSAARAWWMFRIYGHDNVAVLDGGLGAWQRAGLPLESGEASRAPAHFTPRYRAELVRTLAQVRDALGDGSAAGRRCPLPRAVHRSRARATRRPPRRPHAREPGTCRTPRSPAPTDCCSTAPRSKEIPRGGGGPRAAGHRELRQRGDGVHDPPRARSTRTPRSCARTMDRGRSMAPRRVVRGWKRRGRNGLPIAECRMPNSEVSFTRCSLPINSAFGIRHSAMVSYLHFDTNLRGHSW